MQYGCQHDGGPGPALGHGLWRYLALFDVTIQNQRNVWAQAIEQTVNAVSIRS